jgi:hypothetical protein
MRYADKYKCPACGKVIFDRWFTICEKCHTQLPPELLYSEEEKAALRAASKRAKDRTVRIGRTGIAIVFAAMWLVAIGVWWASPRNSLLPIGACTVYTVLIAVKYYAASRDDGLNPSLRKKPIPSPTAKAVSPPTAQEPRQP